PNIQKENLSFLTRSYERHFNERPFLNHRCYLFITQTTEKRMQTQSNFSSLCKGHFLPKQVTQKEHFTRFLEAVAQFERILNDSGFLKLTRLTEKDYIGDKNSKGLWERYFSLTPDTHQSLQDICLSPEEMRIG
ncbi:conjugal transfer protein TraG, partial [Bergeyella sp. RCAD1439]|nr:conjugal transfer protein TraG [Bergeyella sp. RCAD1439]